MAGSTAPFCPRCGYLMQLPDSGSITCDSCKYACGFGDLECRVVVTKGKPRTQPEWQQEVLKGIKDDDTVKKATVDEECSKCKNPTMLFYTMQMRSADEGQTVFYECPKCGYKYSVNT